MRSRRSGAPLVLVLIVLGAGLASGPGAGAAPGEGPAEEPQRPGVQVLGDGLIVPGQRIGPVRLTMTVDQVLAAVGGRPRREEFAGDGIVLYEWRAEGLWVSQALATKAIRVISVFGTSEGYRTTGGVALLHPRARMEAGHGRGYREYPYPEDRIILIRYHPLGLQFGLVHQPSNPTIHQRIFQIGIFAPGDLPPLRRPAR